LDKKIKQYHEISRETQVNNELLFCKFTGFTNGYGLKFFYFKIIMISTYFRVLHLTIASIQQTHNLIFNFVEVKIPPLALA